MTNSSPDPAGVATAHAFDDELGRLDALATAERVRSREVSPAEVVRAAIERAKAVNPSLDAVACEDYDRAIERAEQLAPHGTFAGVPTFIKDMTDVAGLPTRNGSDAFAGAPPAKATMAVAQQLFDMGTVGLGKSTLPEFGFTASTEFPDGTATHNPWNLGRTPGGSSGGAGALVAAGVVPIAHGQDGGGSVRIPAACNGLVGLKPSRGRLVPDPHDRLLPVKIVSDGVLTRTVRDQVAYYREAELRHRSRKLPALDAHGDPRTPIDRPLRIGALIDSPTAAEVDGPTRATFDRTIALLEGLGHHVEPVPPPVGAEFAEAFIHYWSMLAWFVSRFGKQLYDPSCEPDRFTMLSKGLAARFASKAGSTPRAIATLRASARADAAQYHPIDVILSPTIAHLPPELGHLGTTLPFDVLFPRVERWGGLHAARQRHRRTRHQPPARPRRGHQPPRGDDAQRTARRRRAAAAPRAPDGGRPALPDVGGADLLRLSGRQRGRPAPASVVRRAASAARTVTPLWDTRQRVPPGRHLGRLGI